MWLDSGLAILTAVGPKGLTIEKLVETTGLSTGSFYHHFAGMQGFKTALLAHFEDTQTLRYIREVQGAVTDGLDARGQLELLIDLVLTDESTRLEVAIRAWALDDPVAAAVKTRIDTARLTFLRELLGANGYSDTDADEIAHILYLLVLGAGNMLPEVTSEQLRALSRRILS